jgi:hypothetical protein
MSSRLGTLVLGSSLIACAPDLGDTATTQDYESIAPPDYDPVGCVGNILNHKAEFTNTNEPTLTLEDPETMLREDGNLLISFDANARKGDETMSEPYENHPLCDAQFNVFASTDVLQKGGAWGNDTITKFSCTDMSDANTGYNLLFSATLPDDYVGYIYTAWGCAKWASRIDEYQPPFPLDCSDLDPDTASEEEVDCVISLD